MLSLMSASNKIFILYTTFVILGSLNKKILNNCSHTTELFKWVGLKKITRGFERPLSAPPTNSINLIIQDSFYQMTLKSYLSFLHQNVKILPSVNTALYTEGAPMLNRPTISQKSPILWFNSEHGPIFNVKVWGGLSKFVLKCNFTEKGPISYRPEISLIT